MTTTAADLPSTTTTTDLAPHPIAVGRYSLTDAVTGVHTSSDWRCPCCRSAGLASVPAWIEIHGVTCTLGHRSA